jgi:hypothetical protein
MSTARPSTATTRARTGCCSAAGTTSRPAPDRHRRWSPGRIPDVAVHTAVAVVRPRRAPPHPVPRHARRASSLRDLAGGASDAAQRPAAAPGGPPHPSRPGSTRQWSRFSSTGYWASSPAGSPPPLGRRGLRRLRAVREARTHCVRLRSHPRVITAGLLLCAEHCIARTNLRSRSATCRAPHVVEVIDRRRTPVLGRAAAFRWRGASRVSEVQGTDAVAISNVSSTQCDAVVVVRAAPDIDASGRRRLRFLGGNDAACSEESGRQQS